jgi:hypothetical protein
MRPLGRRKWTAAAVALLLLLLLRELTRPCPYVSVREPTLAVDLVAT